MNKFTRFTLFAGALAIGLTACGDDVEVTPPPEPEPDPVVATLQPDAVVLDIGETATLAVNVSGGTAGDTPDWTCEVDNSAVATVAKTSSGCRVTAVEEGNTSVTAVVTKSGETVNAGASVVVPPDDSVPATVAIEKVTQGDLDNPISLNNVRRQVEVTVNIDPGTQVVEEVTLLFRGEEIASQTLTPAQAAELLIAAAEDGPEAQSLRQITFSWETDSYAIDTGGDGVDGTDEVIVDHPNGQGDLVAQIEVDADEGDATRSDSQQITLRNLNGFHLRLIRTGSENTALDVVGYEWRGGRDQGGAVTDAGVDAVLLPVIYTPDLSTADPDDTLDLQSAQFSFASQTRVVTAADGAWTWMWSPAALSSYTMPISTAAFPNQVRDGEFPRLVGGATLEDGQGMGPYGGPLDCTGAVGPPAAPGMPIGILNIEASGAQTLCVGGEGWSPPTATTVADEDELLDPLRSGERIDNEAPEGEDFVLASRPGYPNWPQVPSAPAAGAPVDSDGVWLNDMLDFNDVLDTSGLTDDGVSRAVPGFPAPEFLDPLFTATNGTTEDITEDPTTGNAFFAETATNDVYSVEAVVRDKLDNRAAEDLEGDVGALVFGIDATNPVLMHTVASTQNRMAYDLETVGADDPLTDFYFVSWTDPVTTAASGFSAFGGNPVWRQIHRVFPPATTAVVGGTGVTPVWTGAGLANYSRNLASQQPVTGGSLLDGYFVYRAYALDDAGNISHDGDAAVDEPELEVVSYESPQIVRQAAIAEEQPTVFGVTAPVLMDGGTTVTFVSNASHNFDLGLRFFSLDYPTFQAAPYWAEAGAPAPNSGPGAYFTPASTAAPTEGTTGGVRFQGADRIIGQPDSKIFDEPFEQVSTLVPTSPLSQDVPGFVRSIEWVCGAGGPPGCPAAPADWADIEANLQENVVGGGIAAGWFTDEGVGADAVYEANRVSLASFSVFDATRYDPRTNEWSGTTNEVLEQVGADHAASPFPNRSVSTAPINPVSVPLNEVAGVITAVYTDDVVGAETGDHTAWAIQSASATNAADPVADRSWSFSITARLVGASTVKNDPAPPAQNLFSRIDYFVLEPGTGTLRFGGSQMNPVLTENEPGCVGGLPGVQDQYRCWDFTSNFTFQNLVNAGSGDSVYVLAVGVNADGDAVATYPVEVVLP